MSVSSFDLQRLLAEDKLSVGFIFRLSYPVYFKGDTEITGRRPIKHTKKASRENYSLLAAGFSYNSRGRGGLL